MTKYDYNDFFTNSPTWAGEEPVKPVTTKQKWVENFLDEVTYGYEGYDNFTLFLTEAIIDDAFRDIWRRDQDGPYKAKPYEMAVEMSKAKGEAYTTLYYLLASQLDRAGLLDWGTSIRFPFAATGTEDFAQKWAALEPSEMNKDMYV